MAICCVAGVDNDVIVIPVFVATLLDLVVTVFLLPIEGHRQRNKLSFGVLVTTLNVSSKSYASNQIYTHFSLRM